MLDYSRAGAADMRGFPHLTGEIVWIPDAHPSMLQNAVRMGKKQNFCERRRLGQMKYAFRITCKLISYSVVGHSITLGDQGGLQCS